MLNSQQKTTASTENGANKFSRTNRKNTFLKEQDNTSTGLSSPKQFQRKQSVSAAKKGQIMSRKKEDEENSSPHKLKESYYSGLVKVNSLNSLRNFERQGEDQKNKKKERLLEKGGSRMVTEQKIGQRVEENGMIYEEKQYDLAQSLKLLRKENSSFKRFNEMLESHNRALQQKVSLLERQNLSLNSKIKHLNDELISKECLIEEKQDQLIEKKYQLEKQKKLTFCLENLTNQLNQKIQQINNEKDSELTTETEEFHMKELKEENFKLNSMVKYTDIQIGMRKKVQYELEKEKQFNKQLNNQNRKLLARVSNLEKYQQSVPLSEYRKNPSLDLENSLEFSIEN